MITSISSHLPLIKGPVFLSRIEQNIKVTLLVSMTLAALVIVFLHRTYHYYRNISVTMKPNTTPESAIPLQLLPLSGKTPNIQKTSQQLQQNKTLPKEVKEKEIKLTPQKSTQTDHIDSDAVIAQQLQKEEELQKKSKENLQKKNESETQKKIETNNPPQSNKKISQQELDYQFAQQLAAEDQEIDNIVNLINQTEKAKK